MCPYDDIIDLPHPTSDKHPRMPMKNRAAQFSPFAALTGYEAILRETARLTGRRVELDEQQLEELDRQLVVLAARTEQEPEPPEVKLTYFQQDPLKVGGEYVTETVRVRRVDPIYRVLELEDRRLIEIASLLRVEDCGAAAFSEPGVG